MLKGLRKSISLATASLIFAGCFAPEVMESSSSAGAETDTESTGDTSPTTTDEPTGGMTTANPTGATTTTGDPTTDAPTTDTPTTDEPTTTDPSDPTTGGEAPFCGDGTIDAGEECDDGLENNGLDQSCLPDCNLNVCGDSNVGPDEFCDDGEDDNVLEVGACAPDCSTVVLEREITLGETFTEGNLSPNPVATADATCEPGFAALFSYPGQRRATTTPFEVVDPIDWVLQPWTVYVRAEDGMRVWATDATALLGVRNGVPMALDGPIQVQVSDYGYQTPNGMAADWTTAVAGNSDGWTTVDASVSYGVPTSTTHPDYLRAPGSAPCEFMSQCIFFPMQPSTCNRLSSFVCVEQ